MLVKEGLLAVFASTGENAIGIYFKDSINGWKGKHDIGGSGMGVLGRFYVKKCGLKRGRYGQGLLHAAY